MKETIVLYATVLETRIKLDLQRNGEPTSIDWQHHGFMR